jgi:hypothetical protein
MDILVHEHWRDVEHVLKLHDLDVFVLHYRSKGMMACVVEVDDSRYGQDILEVLKANGFDANEF